ncbi:hypothetical protein IG193_00575 [Infirmifilum lucidum]|uniref:Uncharacterized protein n=1 Tax=Infirmifilum lucidum TaxID=2776706 RepID=A0A7L9FJM8_9CREN|nr:hypothetical protein [Infirmifilum lucidum]QOJ78995.1 hypothetical protein IG193_00575 [Infirmifilum lucidum]
MRREVSVDMPVSSTASIPLYTSEYDAEKDFFPDILSLRMPVITRWSRLEFYRFASKVSGGRDGLQLD